MRWVSLHKQGPGTELPPQPSYCWDLGTVGVGHRTRLGIFLILMSRLDRSLPVLLMWPSGTCSQRGVEVWIMSGLNPDLSFSSTLSNCPCACFKLFHPELHQDQSHWDWQVSAPPCNWNACTQCSEQMCRVTVTLWCLRPNWRSLSWHRVQSQREKRQRRPFIFIFLLYRQIQPTVRVPMALHLQ